MPQKHSRKLFSSISKLKSQSRSKKIPGSYCRRFPGPRPKSHSRKRLRRCNVWLCMVLCNWQQKGTKTALNKVFPKRPSYEARHVANQCKWHALCCFETWDLLLGMSLHNKFSMELHNKTQPCSTTRTSEN